MTIVKIKNPVLRWLVGLVIVAAIVVVGAIIIYGVGCIAVKIPFLTFRHFAGNFVGTSMAGLGLLSIVGLAVCMGIAICVGAYALGQKFFDP